MWHEKVDACSDVEILGVIVDGRWVRAGPAKVWGLWRGVGAIVCGDLQDGRCERWPATSCPSSSSRGRS